jgi:hypothetical protein
MAYHPPIVHPCKGDIPMVTPAFTRADIEAFFNRHYSTQDYPKCEIESVHLLPELSPPTWRVRYKAAYADSRTLYFDLVITQFDSVVGPYLNLVTEVDA